MDYTALSLAEVIGQLDDMARDSRASFGALDAGQLNWRPDATQWSVAQCFEHLLMANRLMLGAARAALDGTETRTVWQRLPILPGLFGRMLIRSQAPTATRKFTAAPVAQPAASDIAADIIDRVVDQHRDARAWAAALDEGDAMRAIMISPFVRVITYSVLDGLRLIAAHDRRHFEQARRVASSPGFPRSW
jgi:hypothetical protein